VRKDFSYYKDSLHDRGSNPFTIAFVYSRYHEPYVVKGGWKDVDRYLENQKEPLIAHTTFWKDRWFRLFIRIYNTKTSIHHSDQGWELVGEDGKRCKKHVLYTWMNNGEKVVIASFKRFPRKWIKQLEEWA